MTPPFFQISVLPSGNQNMACWKIRHFFLDDFSLQNLQFFGDFPVPSLITRGYIPLKSIKPLSFLIIIFLWWLIYSHGIQTYSRDFPFSSTSRAYLVLLSAGSFAQIPGHGPRGVAASWAGSPRDERSATRWSLKGLIDWKKRVTNLWIKSIHWFDQKTKAIRM